jgi:hypothetical protein
VSEAPQYNVDAFHFLYSIETLLRELIVQTLEPIASPRWYRSRLPPDLLTKYREAVAHERRTPWHRLVSHHPVYYLEFPDLRKIMARNDNWTDAFQKIFARKDTLAATLIDLEPIRNGVAHNRRLTPTDVQIVRASYEKLTNAVGADLVRELLASANRSPDIRGHLSSLRAESLTLLSACLSYQAAPWTASLGGRIYCLVV